MIYDGFNPFSLRSSLLFLSILCIKKWRFDVHVGREAHSPFISFLFINETTIRDGRNMRFPFFFLRFIEDICEGSYQIVRLRTSASVKLSDMKSVLGIELACHPACTLPNLRITHAHRVVRSSKLGNRNGRFFAMRKYQSIAIPALCSENPGCHKPRRMDSANFSSVFRVTSISQHCPKADLVNLILQLHSVTITISSTFQQCFSQE